MSEETIGVVGVGLMGHGIASNIQKKGWRLAFLDHPGNQPTDDLRAGGAWVAKTPKELAARCDTLILCLTGTPQVEAVLTGPDGILEALRPGATVIDCSTAVPSSTLRLAPLVEAAGGQMLDAPMTRTPKEAAEGRLNLIVGGDRTLFEQKLPLLQSFAENITHAGGHGAGHTLKLLHNFVSLGFSAVLAEASAASNKAGIDPQVFRSVLANGGGAGVVLERLTPFILDGDVAAFRFTIANAFKDIDYYHTMALEMGASATTAAGVREAYKAQVDDGHAGGFVPEMIKLLG